MLEGACYSRLQSRTLGSHFQKAILLNSAMYLQRKFLWAGGAVAQKMVLLVLEWKESGMNTVEYLQQPDVTAVRIATCITRRPKAVYKHVQEDAKWLEYKRPKAIINITLTHTLKLMVDPQH